MVSTGSDRCRVMPSVVVKHSAVAVVAGVKWQWQWHTRLLSEIGASPGAAARATARGVYEPLPVSIDRHFRAQDGTPTVWFCDCASLAAFSSSSATCQQKDASVSSATTPGCEACGVRLGCASGCSMNDCDGKENKKIS